MTSIMPDSHEDEPGTGTGADLVAVIRALVEPFGGIELELPPREPMREPPGFSADG